LTIKKSVKKMEAIQVKEQYIEKYRNPGLAASGKDLAWLKALRERAMASFGEKGFPTPKDESWKYTDLTTNILKETFDFDVDFAAKTNVLSRLKSMAFQTEEIRVAVFVNGRFSKALSSLAKLPNGVRVQNLAGALANQDVEKHLGKILPPEGRAFAALNTAFFTDGLFLQVPPGLRIPQPIHAVYLSFNGGKQTQSHPRNLILLGEDSQATLIEHYWGDNVGPYLTNVLTEVGLSRGAFLEHVKIQDESREAYHIGSLAVKQEEASRLVSRNFLIGAGFSHQETESLLAGMKGECVYEGLYLLKGEQHMDILTFIDHQSPSCKSHELFKGVLDGKATGVFGGRILVRENAQKTDARQVNKDLQLSNETKVYSKPQLQIYADDVKCSHGSATGQMDEEELFYLQSRGLGKDEAQRILVNAFAGEMLDKVKGYLEAPLRKMAEDWMEEKR
jgi:Fe-S cluster assembly protein SufD